MAISNDVSAALHATRLETPEALKELVNRVSKAYEESGPDLPAFKDALLREAEDKHTAEALVQHLEHAGKAAPMDVVYEMTESAHLVDEYLNQVGEEPTPTPTKEAAATRVVLNPADYPITHEFITTKLSDVNPGDGAAIVKAFKEYVFEKTNLDIDQMLTYIDGIEEIEDTEEFEEIEDTEEFEEIEEPTAQ